MLPSLSFEWHWYWWKHYRPDRRLNIVIALRNKEVVGILPLTLGMDNIYRFIPECSVDYLTAFCTKECLESLEILFGSLDKSNGFDLRNIPFENPAFSVIGEFFSKNKSGTTIKKEKIYKIRIEGTWADYLRSRTRNFRRMYSKKISKLSDLGKIDFIVKSPSKRDLLSAMNLHISRWDSTNTPSKFLSESRRNLVLDLFACKRVSLKPVIFQLLMNNKIASYRLGFISRRTYFDWNTAYDRSYGKLFSPGMVLLGKIVKALFDRELSIDCFDFMRGDELYKLCWSNSHTWNYSFLCSTGSACAKKQECL
jgi:hypothetical protein